MFRLSLRSIQSSTNHDRNSCVGFEKRDLEREASKRQIIWFRIEKLLDSASQSDIGKFLKLLLSDCLKKHTVRIRALLDVFGPPLWIVCERL